MTPGQHQAMLMEPTTSSPSSPCSVPTSPPNPSQQQSDLWRQEHICRLHSLVPCAAADPACNSMKQPARQVRGCTQNGKNRDTSQGGLDNSYNVCMHNAAVFTALNPPPPPPTHTHSLT